MTDTPPDDIDDLYRRAAARDSSRPDEVTRRAILDHAARLAAERAAFARPIDIERARRGRRRAWRPAVVGTLAATLLAGVVVLPRLWTPPPSSTDAPVPAPAPAPAAARPSTPPPRVAELTQDSPAARGAAATQRQAAESSALPQTPTLAEATRSAEAARSAQQSQLPSAFSSRQTQGLSRARQAVDAAGALRRAAQAGDVRSLNETLGEPVDVDARDEGGRTALMLAILNGRGSAVNALLAHGADPNAADAAGLTPLAAALDRADPAIVSALRRAGARADR